ncbi:MAG: hypothetical protein A2030_05735 [Chloroflexi bacterium RBG_19FT_COMBO_50_10]|nr:MAG: hypothetical protein A2030_05735 [Chloroflexi bacterium RBG_19FT_COMBO_50_10]
MSYKFKRMFVIMGILITAMLTMASARGWENPLAQMDMPTETMQSQSTSNPVLPQLQDTPTPMGMNTEQSAPSPSMTSIFTGFTPYPNSTSTYYDAMGGSGMMGSGMMGSSSGMSAGGTMGTGGMGMSGMEMSGCSMMSGTSMDTSGMMGTSGMAGMNMGDDSGMAGMDMGDDMWIEGMNTNAASSSVENDFSLLSSNPWTLLGWVILGLVVIAILVAAGLGIAWLFRRSKRTPQVQP